MPTLPEHRPEGLDQLLGRDRGVPARDANGVDRPYGPNAYVQLRGPAGPGRLARGQERQYGVFMGAAPPRQGPLRKERAQPPAGALRPHDDVAFPDRRRARTGLQSAVALGGSGVSGHLLRLALGRTRTCAHGSGGPCTIRRLRRSLVPSWSPECFLVHRWSAARHMVQGGSCPRVPGGGSAVTAGRPRVRCPPVGGKAATVPPAIR